MRPNPIFSIAILGSMAVSVPLAALAEGSAPLIGGQTPSAQGAQVYFVNLADGDTVTSPVTVVFGLQAMGVAPAGVERDHTGHHHLLIDRPPLGSVDADEAAFGLPSDAHHRHFGGGQTQVTLDLSPGPHTLQLVLGDAGHVPHNPPVMSDQITITVE